MSQAVMTQAINAGLPDVRALDCPECGGDRLFERHHASGVCPDVPDGECPEWSCTDCGAALLAGFVLYHADPALGGRAAGGPTRAPQQARRGRAADGRVRAPQLARRGGRARVHPPGRVA